MTQHAHGEVLDRTHHTRRNPTAKGEAQSVGSAPSLSAPRAGLLAADARAVERAQRALSGIAGAPCVHSLIVVHRPATARLALVERRSSSLARACAPGGARSWRLWRYWLYTRWWRIDCTNRTPRRRAPTCSSVVSSPTRGGHGNGNGACCSPRRTTRTCTRSVQNVVVPCNTRLPRESVTAQEAGCGGVKP